MWGGLRHKLCPSGKSNLYINLLTTTKVSAYIVAAYKVPACKVAASIEKYASLITPYTSPGMYESVHKIAAADARRDL